MSYIIMMVRRVVSLSQVLHQSGGTRRTLILILIVFYPKIGWIRSNLFTLLRCQIWKMRNSLRQPR